MQYTKFIPLVGDPFEDMNFDCVFFFLLMCSNASEGGGGGGQGEGGEMKNEGRRQ